MSATTRIEVLHGNRRPDTPRQYLFVGKLCVLCVPSVVSILSRALSMGRKIQAVATSADDGLLFPPERYPELTNQARQSGSRY